MEAVADELSLNKEWIPKTSAERQAIVVQMEQILASPHFSQSKRSQTLFRYIVAKTLDGQLNVLKERTLGTEVFNRTPEYDTNADPIVRMTAGEIRKRIAQYYHDSGHRHELQIDIPSGSYVAQFRRPYPSSEPQPGALQPVIAQQPEKTSDERPSAPERATPLPNVPSFRIRPLGLLAGGLLLSLIALYLVFLHLRPSFVERAWGKALVGSSTTLISIGEPKLYVDPKWSNTQTSVSGVDHIAADVLTYSEVQALLRIVQTFEREKVHYKVQVGGSTTFADLRQGPTVLLGGLNQPWTLRAQQNLRYRLATDGKGLDWILDAKDPTTRKYTVDLTLPYSSLTADYAIVARFLDPNTQEPTLIVAGVGEDGTRAASEFVTSEKQLQDSLGPLLEVSEGKNFEVVLGTQVINGVSGPPKVLASEVW